MKIRVYVVFNIIALVVIFASSHCVNGQSTNERQLVPTRSSSASADKKVDGDNVAFVAKGEGTSEFVSAPAKTKKTETGDSNGSWSGFYLGGNFGYSSGKTGTKFDPLPTPAIFIDMLPVTLDSTNKGYTVGATAGYNWQSGHFVAGPEFSLAWSNIKGTKTVTPIIRNNGSVFPGGIQTTSQDVDYLGTLRFRAGGAWGRVFIYGTAGLAFGKINYSALTDYRPVGTTQYQALASKTQTGWTAGFGTEIAVSRHWSLKGEYLYYDLGNGPSSTTVNPTPALPPFQVRYTWQSNHLHSFNTGINFRW